MATKQISIAVPTPRRATWPRLRQIPSVSAFIIAVFVFVALAAPLLTAYSPTEQSLPDRLTPPAWQQGGSWKHVLGTDAFGRDVLTRMFYGARITLLVTVLTLVTGGGIGITLGILSGYLGGRLDTILMRAVDATLSFPTILIALLLAVTMGPGLRTVIIAICLIVWARFARVIRAEVLALKSREFVALATIHGCSPLRIMKAHLAPNVFNTFMVILTLHVGYVILLEASLSFLGAGIPAPTASWGQMVSEGRTKIASAWWISIIPGVAIMLVVLAFNLFGDWLRDRLDPKLRSL